MDIYERREVVEALATAVDAKDGEVFGHSHRVADLAVLLGQEVGLAGERLHQLYVRRIFMTLARSAFRTRFYTKPDRYQAWNGAGSRRIRRSASGLSAA